MTLSAIVVANLLYVLGAGVGVVVGATAVTLRYRRPTSVEAHVASFHRSLQALAPDRQDPARRPDPTRRPGPTGRPDPAALTGGTVAPRRAARR